jgi:hypothetical protein
MPGSARPNESQPGSADAFLNHIRRLREHGVHTFFSIGLVITEPIRTAITACVDWIPAIDGDRELRAGAEIAEITHLVDLSTHPDGARMIVRRERPHPGAQRACSTPSTACATRCSSPTPGAGLIDAAARATSPQPYQRRGPHPLRQGQRVRPVPGGYL